MKCKIDNCNLNTEINHDKCIGHEIKEERILEEQEFFSLTGKKRIEVSELFGDNCDYDDAYCSTKVILTPEQIEKIKEILK